jgi:hypothetical protein
MATVDRCSSGGHTHKDARAERGEKVQARRVGRARGERGVFLLVTWGCVGARRSRRVFCVAPIQKGESERKREGAGWRRGGKEESER